MMTRCRMIANSHDVIQLYSNRNINTAHCVIRLSQQQAQRFAPSSIHID